MHKALAIAAIATLAMGSEDLAAENELNFFKSIGNGLKKAGTFVIQHPKIITTAAKILAVDDEELFSLHNAIHKAEEGVKKAEKKAVDYVAQHPEVVREAIEILKNLKHDDEELFHLGKTIHNVAHAVGKVEHVAKDGLQVVKDVQSGNYIGAVQHGIKTVKDVKHDDEELFHLGKVVHNVAHAVGKVEHIAKDGLQVVKDVQTGNYIGAIQHGVQTVKDAKKHDDEELFNLGNLIHDGMNIAKDIKTKNYGGLINHGIQTVKDVKRHDDEELFHLGKVVHNVAHAVGKVEHIAKDGLQVVKDVQTGNYIGAIQHGVQTVKDAKKHDDEELFNLGNLINDGIHIAKDIKEKNYGNLVNDSIQTVKDVKQATHGKKFLRH